MSTVSSPQLLIGVVLAGGRSTRMHVPKAELTLERAQLQRWDQAEITDAPVEHRRQLGASASDLREAAAGGGEPAPPGAQLASAASKISLLEWTAVRLASVCEQVVVAGGNPAASSRSLAALGLPWVRDAAGQGPIAGIVGAADAFPGARLLVLACDLPLVRTATLRRLLDHGQQSPREAVVASFGERWQPLLALYGQAALAELRAALRREHLALHRLLDEGVVSVSRLELGPGARSLQPRSDAEPILELEAFNLNSPDDYQRVQALLAEPAQWAGSVR